MLLGETFGLDQGTGSLSLLDCVGSHAKSTSVNGHTSSRLPQDGELLYLPRSTILLVLNGFDPTWMAKEIIHLDVLALVCNMCRRPGGTFEMG